MCSLHRFQQLSLGKEFYSMILQDAETCPCQVMKYWPLQDRLMSGSSPVLPPMQASKAGTYEGNNQRSLHYVTAIEDSC